VPLLGPSGHGGVGALQAPSTDRAAGGPYDPAQPRAAHKAAILPATQH